MSIQTAFYKCALNGLYYSGAHHALRDRFRGVGALLTLHHVQPGIDKNDFAPNSILSVTPEFLDSTIQRVRSLGYDIVALDEAHRRLIEKDFHTPFVSFTLDDGYADNYTHAFPVFRKHRVPFTIYLCTGLMDGSVDPWWMTLEEIVLKQERVEVTLDGTRRTFTTESTREKYRAYESIYWPLRRMPLPNQLATMRALRDEYLGNPDARVAPAEYLSPEMIAEMQASGLLTIGAHTVNHYALSKLSDDEVRDEMSRGRDVLEQRTGERARHFAYPYGDAGSAARREFEIAEQLGFLTAVSTRKGVLFPEHGEHLQALPRISLNGNYQQTRNIELFLGGVPFALFHRFRKLDVS
jgi:peptidoglycan/xylan/chitin deacetylase (PgdA/CDA1 family)